MKPRLFTYLFLISLILLFISCSKKSVSKKTFDQTTSDELVLMAGGDLVCGSGVERAISKYGFGYPFLEIKHIIKDADISFANLECVISDKGKLRSKHYNKVNYNASTSVLENILFSGIDVLSIANNHVYDLGETGLLRHHEILKSSPLYFGGAGKDHRDASKPVIVEANGLRIAFLFYTSIGLSFCADKNKAGYNCLPIKDKAKALDILKNDMKSISTVDIKILSIHWGPNYNTKTSEHQIDFAHSAIESGVDIILGHSSHLFHGVEIYKNKPIIYDMGDLLVDKYDGWDTRSFIYLLHIKKEMVTQVEMIPIYIPNSQIKEAKGIMADDIIERAAVLNKRFNTIHKKIKNRMLINTNKTDTIQ